MTGKLAYKSTELKAAYKNAQRQDIINYLQEWDNHLTTEIQADEEIAVGFDEMQRDREEKRLLAEAGQESFSSFKQWNANSYQS